MSDVDRAIALLDLGRADDALALAASALAANPEDSRLLCLVGVCHLQRRDAPTAVLLFERAVSIDPEDPDTHRLLSLGLTAVGNHDAALNAAETYVRLAPDDIDARARWAECLEEFPQRREEALANARWVSHQRPEDPESHLLLALVLAGGARPSRNDLNAAVAAVDRAAALDPTSARVQSVRAIVGIARRRPGVALRAATEAVLLAPSEQATREVATQVLRILVLIPYTSLILVFVFRAYAVLVALFLTVVIALAYIRVVRRSRWAFVRDFVRTNRHFAFAELMLWMAGAWWLGTWALDAPVWVPGIGVLVAVLAGLVALVRAPDLQ